MVLADFFSFQMVDPAIVDRKFERDFVGVIQFEHFATKYRIARDYDSTR